MTWKTILEAAVGLIGLIREIFAQKKSREDRQAGAAQAKVEGLQQEADALKKTQAAINAAAKEPMKDSDYRD